MDTKSTDVNTRNDFYSLVHHRCGGDLRIVEAALSKHPNRKVSLRTIQSWLASSEKPSSRSCPDWAPSLLREFLEENTDHVERIHASTQKEKTMRRTLGYGSRHEELVDLTVNARADQHIQRVAALAEEFASATLAEMPGLLAHKLFQLELELAAQSRHLNCFFDTLDKADSNTSVCDLKKQFHGQRCKLASSDLQIYNTKRNIVEQTEEFSSPDGTLAK